MDLISEIKARADIVQIIGATVPLKKAGKDFKARCPFHSEKTPSFTVSAEKQLFYCFGCGTGGDLIRFVMLIEKIDTAEAIRRLADRLGIVRPQGQSRGSAAEPLREALELAAKFYEAALTSSHGEEARAYLAERRMPAESAALFRVGCAPNQPDILTRRLLDKGIAEKVLTGAGLSAPAAGDSGRLQDRFRDRLMFPILDGSGRVVGFGGRVIRKTDRRPKYLNTAETEIFHKGTILYGYHAVRNRVSSDCPPVLVEGYLDVIYAQSAGLAALAALGTSLTDVQSDLLARFHLPVILGYDADAPGKKAAIRAMKLLFARDVEIRVLEFPGGKDPAELVEQGRSDELAERAGRASSGFDVLVRTALELFPDTLAGKRQAAALIAETGAGLRDGLLRQGLVRAFSSGFDLSPAVSTRMLGFEDSAPARGSPPPARNLDGETQAKRRADALVFGEDRRREWMIVGASLARENLMALAYAQIEDGDFEDPVVRMVWDAMAAQYERRHAVDVSELAAAFADHPKAIDRLTEMKIKPMPESYLTPEGLADLLTRQRLSQLRRQSARLRERLKTAEEGRDREELKRLQEEDRRLQEQMQALTAG